MTLIHKELCQRILKCAYAVHTELGPGLLESVYQECLKYELETEGLFVQREFSFPVVYKNHTIDQNFRLDFFVEKAVILELKAQDVMHPIYDAVLLNYLKLMKCRVGYLINYNVISLKDGIKRFVK